MEGSPHDSHLLEAGAMTRAVSIPADRAASPRAGRRHAPKRPRDTGQLALDFGADVATLPVLEIAPDTTPVSAVEPAAEPAAVPGPHLTLVMGGQSGLGGRPPVAANAHSASPSWSERADAEPDAEHWYHAGLELEASSPAEAIAAYARAVEDDPSHSDAHVNLGRLYHLTGERGRAEAQYRDAVRLAADDPVPHFNLGVLLEEQGRREEAVYAYNQAVARDPEFADAHCNLGILLESMGRKQDAMRHLMTARELYRTS